MSARETPQEGCVSAKLFNYCKFLHSALLHALLWVPVQECRGISEAKERGGVSRRASGMNGGLTHFQLLLLTAFSGWLTLFCASTWAFIASSSLPHSLLCPFSLLFLANFYFCLPPIDFINLPLICIFFAFAFGLVDFAFSC